MKDHTLICKFIGAWPTEKELIKWIQQWWKPKGHIDLKLGVKEKGKKTYEWVHTDDRGNISKLGESGAITRGISTTPKIVEMIITTWNIRFLKSRGKQRYLKERLKKYRPSIMILQETKISKRNLKEVLENYKPQYQVIG